MNDTRTEDLQTSFTRLDGRVSGLESSVLSLGADVKSLVSTVNASQRTNWPLFLGVMAMLCTMAGGFWVIIDLKNQVALSPVASQNMVSMAERMELKREVTTMVAALSEEMANRKAGFSALQQQTVESETQHRTRDAVSQLQFQHLESLISMLYQYAKLPTPPPLSYAPAIGRMINTPIPNN